MADNQFCVCNARIIAANGLHTDTDAATATATVAVKLLLLDVELRADILAPLGLWPNSCRTVFRNLLRLVPTMSGSEWRRSFCFALLRSCSVGQFDAPQPFEQVRIEPTRQKRRAKLSASFFKLHDGQKNDFHELKDLMKRKEKIHFSLSFHSIPTWTLNPTDRQSCSRFAAVSFS